MPAAPNRAMVFGPEVTLSVTIEQGPDAHVHAGGQAFWIAQLMAQFCVDVSMTAPLGGETGIALPALIARAGVRLRATGMTASNAISVHDRRDGRSVAVADIASCPLSR